MRRSQSLGVEIVPTEFFIRVHERKKVLMITLKFRP